MKKIVCIAVCIIMLTLIVGCGNNKQDHITRKHVDYTYLYKNILDQYKKACEISGDIEYDYKSNLSVGFWEFKEEKDLLHKVGYKLQDLNGDGVDELMISLLEKKGFYNYIVAIYQHIDGKGVRKVEDGWARNRYYLLKNNIFLNEASGGAAYTYISKLKMVGKELKTLCMLGTDLNEPVNEDDDYKEIYLYNKNGKTSNNKEFYISKKEWNRKYSEWQTELVEVDFIPFADYK